LEENIFEAILAHEPLASLTVSDIHKWLNETVLAWLARQDAPHSADWALYHALQSAEIWRLGWPKDYRRPLEQALQKLMATPEDVFSHFIALLYKRYYAKGQSA